MRSLGAWGTQIHAPFILHMSLRHYNHAASLWLPLPSQVCHAWGGKEPQSSMVSKMWELQALCSLSVHVNVVFGHPQSGMSFTAAALGVHQLPCQSVGDTSQGRGRGFIQLRAVAEPWVRYRASFCPTLGPCWHPLPFLTENDIQSRFSWHVCGSFSTSIIEKLW